MFADKISLEAKSDLLICKFGSRYLRTHRERHHVNVCSRKMREISKLLIEVKSLNPSIKNLYDALQPVYFDSFVQATKIVAKYDSLTQKFESPTYAMNIQTSLKQCCDIAILVGLRRKRENFTIASADTEANFVMFKRLLEDDWKFEISTSAAHDLHIKKWNKITILPLAADLRDFRQYLLKEANACFDILNKEPTNKKTLDEINLNLEEAIIEDSDSEPEEDFEENLQQHEPALPSCSIPIKKKRCLVPWTQEQKDLTKQHFVSHIKSKVPPRKKDVEELKILNPGKFDNKSWEQIKVFVQNIYKKK
ncbi:hypothetical protein JTB14_029982 [Gonioctena quinquepunctata]|nr:hypothetical protein JTB14_029982 [Gonioctena quinquepunctata]